MPTAPYDAIADWYDQQVREGALLHELVVPALLAMAGELRDVNVCDLACGQGVVSRLLADHGARVTGVDLSERLFSIARREEATNPRSIHYLQEDAQVGATLTDENFDGVVCNMALMDFPDLDAALRTTYRILRPHGWFVCSMTHPWTQAPYRAGVVRDVTGADGGVARLSGEYFAEGFWQPADAPGLRGRVGTHHRTLSTLVNALAHAGFAITQLEEPQATDALAERLPLYRNLPAALLIRGEKRGA